MEDSMMRSKSFNFILAACAVTIYNDEPIDMWRFMLQYKQFRSGYGNSTVTRELSGRLRSIRLSNGFLSISFPLSPLNHTIKWNALAEVSSAIFISEMGHVTLRYDAIYLFKEKYPDCLLPISQSEQTATKKLLCSKFGEWFTVRFYLQFSSKGDFIVEAKSTSERVVPVIYFVNFVQTKNTIDIRFRDDKWKCIEEQVFSVMTQTSKTMDLITWSKFAQRKLIAN